MRDTLPTPITRSFWIVVGLATGVLVLLVSVILSNRELARDGREAHDALCVFKADLIEGRDRTQSYLDAQPKADPVIVFGLEIPRDTLISNVSTQTSRIESLNKLECGP